MARGRPGDGTPGRPRSCRYGLKGRRGGSGFVADTKGGGGPRPGLGRQDTAPAFRGRGWRLNNQTGEGGEAPVANRLGPGSAGQGRQGDAPAALPGQGEPAKATTVAGDAAPARDAVLLRTHRYAVGVRSGSPAQGS